MIYDPEISALLSIVSQKGNTGISGIDISRLIRLAFRHKTVYQLLSFARKNRQYFTEDHVNKLEEHSHTAAMLSLTQLYELKKICDLFNIEGIGYVCIKGPQLSRMIYGREALKESVDLDIMLTKADELIKVHTLLLNLGYDQSNLNDYTGKYKRRIFLIGKREVHYYSRKSRCAIDLHIRPGANTYLTEKQFKGFLEDLSCFDLEGTQVPVLKDEAYFVYLCYHGALHQFARLAWLVDIRAFLKTRSPSFDFNKVLSIAGERKTERSVYLALQLIREYFEEDFFSQRTDWRINLLSGICHSMLSKESEYGISLKGRIQKVVYVMFLQKGLSAKLDWIYGIVIRQILRMV